MTQAIFLSYSSDDAEAARRICESLRAAGLEVWFDQSELRGGDAWDQSIRKQIKECALFVPIISSNANARPEGYFRLEWKLAVDRTHLMADNVPFLLPVVIDQTPDASANVPEKFRERQWTRLPGGHCDATFVAQIQQLLSAGRVTVQSTARVSPVLNVATRQRKSWWIGAAVAMVIALVIGAAYLARVTAPVAEGKAAAMSSPNTVAERIAKARALLDDDPLRTRRNVELAEQLALEAIEKDPTNAEAAAAVAWVNYRYLESNYEDTPKRRADLRSYAEKAKLLAPDSIYAELAMGGLLVLNGNWDEANRRMEALAERAPNNLAVLHTATNAVLRSFGNAVNPSNVDGSASIARLRRLSVLGKAYADTQAAAEYWRKGEYVEADRLLDATFAAGQPTGTTYLMRLLILTYGWGDLAAARKFAATIPAKLLLEDVFIYHLSTVEMYSGEYEKALETLSRTQREILKEGLIEISTARQRGDVHAAAGRPAAAAIQWREALKVIDRQLSARPDRGEIYSQRALLLANLGERKEALAAHEVARQLRGSPAAGSIAWGRECRFYAAIGDVDGAFVRFDRLVQRDYGRWPTTYNDLRNNPAMESLRKNPRFKPILERGARWLAEMKAAGQK